MKNNRVLLKKNFVLAAAILVTFFLVLAFILAAMDLKDGMPLQVTYKRLAYKSIDLPSHDHFDTGRQGELWWHPQSFSQALILGTEDGSGIDVYQITLLYLLVLTFYVMLKGSEAEVVFSKKVSSGFIRIILMLAVSGSLEQLKSILVSLQFSNITGGKFDQRISCFPSMFYYGFGMMLFFIVKFPQKAIELQQEAELTI